MAVNWGPGCARQGITMALFDWDGLGCIGAYRPTVLLFDGHEPAVESVELGLIVLRPFGHFGCSTQACEHSGDVLFRPGVEFVRTSFAAGHNVWISQLIRMELRCHRDES